MMIGEHTRPANPTVQIPVWDPSADQPSSPFSPLKFNGNATSPVADYLAALQRFLPSNEFDSDSLAGDSDVPIVDAFSCDHFRMYDFKVRRCARVRSHDWTECPYAHPGEKASRRDPRKYHYSGTACPDFRKGSCRKGDSCEFAHGVFECWLHPARYRTQPCKDGTSCTRWVCFFAHTPDQLRVLPQQSPKANGSGSSDFDYVESSRRYRFDFVSSPPSSATDSFNLRSDLVACMRNLQLSKISMSGGTNWGLQTGPGFGSPRGIATRPGFCSSPSTPTRTPTRHAPSQTDLWDATAVEEEPAMERVESGRDLRAKMYAKLCKENPLEPVDAGGSGPDLGWISELVM